MSGEAAPAYRVIYLPAVLDRLRQMGDRAPDLRQHLATTLGDIHRSLSTDPIGWGDPYRQIHSTGTVLYRRIYDTLHLTYGVSVSRNTVIVNQVETLSNSPYGEFP